MLKKTMYYILISMVVGFLISQAVNAATNLPGNADNPVITKSYANKVFQPLKDQIAFLQGEIAKLKEKSELGNKPKFTDVPITHWAFRDIQFMVDNGVISGLGAGKFGPSNPARRCELAVMLVKALKLSTTDIEGDFKDVPKGHWAYAQIAAAQKAGVISGFPGGLFKPNEYVTRGQMAAMIARAYSLQRNSSAVDFKDVTTDYWAYEAIQKLADNKITKGYEDLTFRPKDPVRRGEVAVFLTKALDPSRRI